MKNFDCNRFHHPYHAYNQHSCSSRSGGGSNNNNHGGPHHNNSISHNNGYHPYQQQPTRHQQQQHQTQQQQQLSQLPTYFNYHQRHAQQQQQPQLQQQLNQQLQHFNNSSPLQQHQQQNLMTTSATTAAVAAITSASSASSDSAASLPSLLLSSATACNQRPNTLNIQGATYANFIANYNQNNNNNNHPNNNNNNTNINGTCGNNNNNSNNNSSNNNSNINITNPNIQHVVNQQQQQQKQQPQQQKQQQQLQSQVQQQQQQEDAAVASATTVDKFTMDACEIANFLANELFMQQLVSVDGIQSGVPTLTTPTLTPTTLRSIEETFIQMTSEPNNAPYQAGFIPPPLAPFPSLANTSSLGDGSVLQAITTFSSIQDYNDNLDTESEDSQASWNEAQLHEENSQATTDTSSAATDSTSYQNGLNGMGNNSLATSTTSSTNDFSSMNIAIAAAAAAAKNGGLLTSTPNNKNTSHSATSSTTTTRRNQGGRRPTKSANMSPEEEEKRRIRRERNKLAAARCRKRRVDQTNELLDEVAVLENKRASLQNDIETLTQTKQELEYILEAHRPTCQKERQDILTVSTFGGLIAPVSSSASNASASITGLDPTLAATGRSISPIELKPDILPDNMLDVVQHIKNEPIDSALDSGSSLDGPPSPKRILLTRNNPMIPPPLPLPHVATLSPSLAAASASLNTPIVTSAPVSFGSFSNSNATLNTLNALNNKPPNGSKQRPNSLPGVPRNLGQNLGLNVVGKNPTDINGVAIQTPSTGMFNFDSLMDGGTGLTPVSGPLVPTCSSQNKHPLELTTPTSEPSKLVSL